MVTFEPHNWNIPRRIIAEEYLIDKSTTHISSSLVDYKFWCLNGEPDITMVLFDREYLSLKENVKNKKLNMKASVYDLDWNLRTDLIAGPLAKEKSLPFPEAKMF